MGWTTNLILFSPISEQSIVSSHFSHIYVLSPYRSDRKKIAIGKMAWDLWDGEGKLFGLPPLLEPFKKGIYPRIIHWGVYGGFLKWWYPTTMGFPTKNDHFGLFCGYHHLRKHPYGVDEGVPRHRKGFFQHFPLWKKHLGWGHPLFRRPVGMRRL